MTLTPHGEPRCPYVAASKWGPVRCVLPEGHTGRHAYGASEGGGVSGVDPINFLIREWAAANGLRCTTRGPIPHLVRMAYAQAARIAELEAQVAGMERMNTEKAAVIRRMEIRAANHPSTNRGAL